MLVKFSGERYLEFGQQWLKLLASSF